MPRQIREFAPMYPENIGGDLYVLIPLSFFWMAAFIAVEKCPARFFDCFFTSKTQVHHTNTREDVA